MTKSAAPAAVRESKTQASARRRSEAPAGGGTLTGLSWLHATAGNHGVERFLQRSGIFVQRKCKACEEGGEECPRCARERVQRKTKPGQKADQSYGAAYAAVSAVVHSGGGRPLDTALRSILEPRIGANLEGIRLHTDATAARSAEAINALAYTAGRNIVFAPGQYAPYSRAGFELLVHEIAHSLQQRNGGSTPGFSEAERLESEADRAAAAIVNGQPAGTVTAAGARIQRAPGDDPLTQATDPIDDVDYPDHSFTLVVNDFDQPPTLAEIRSALESFGIVAPQTLAECTAAQFKMIHSDSVYWAFRHPTLGVVARAKGSKARYGPTPSDPVGYGVYVYESSNRPAEEGEEGKTARKSGQKGEQGKGTPGQGTGKQKGPEGTPQTATGQKPAGGQQAGDEPKTTGSQRGGMDPQTTPGGQGQADRDRQQAIKDWPDWLRSQFGLTLQPDQFEQARRIAQTLKAMTPDDLEMLRQAVTVFGTDLEAFEKSLGIFNQVKDRVKSQVTAATPHGNCASTCPAKKPHEETLEEKLAKTYEKIDETKFGTMTTSEKEQQAYDIAAEQRDIILKHAVTHPGETISNVITGTFDVNKVSSEIAADIGEALAGDTNGWGRASALAGALGKSSGWLAAVAGLFAIMLLFVPGVNVAALVTFAIEASVVALVATTAEATLRIKAAGAESDVDKYKKHIGKSGAAQASATMQGAMLALGFAGKLVAKIPLPGRLESVGNALKTARAALSQKTGSAFRSVRNELLAKLRGAHSGLKQALAKEAKALKSTSEIIEKINGDEFLERLAKGDPALEPLGIGAEQAKAVQAASKQLPDANITEQLRQQVLRDIQDAPELAGQRLDDFARNVDQTLDEVRAAKSAEELETAVRKGEERFEPENVAAEAEAQKQGLLQERAAEDAFRGQTDAEVRAAAQKDPAAVDELLRRYRGKKARELEKLKKTDATAEYELARRRATHRKPAKVPQKPTNLDVLGRLRARLSQLRRRQRHQDGTLLTAETDMALETVQFEAGSPKTGAAPDPTYTPPSTHPKAQGHAEQNLVGALKRAILKDKPDMHGKTVYVLVEREVCQMCKAGLYSESAEAGVLQQFSREFPELTIEIVNLQTSEVVRILNGNLIGAR